MIPYRTDAWTTFSPATKLGKTRQRISVTGFSQHCVEANNQCLSVAYNGYTYYDGTANAGIKSTFTNGPLQVDCWVKPGSVVSGSQETCYVFGRGFNDTTMVVKSQWQMKISSANKLLIKFTDNTGTQTEYTSTAKVNRNQWNHIGFQWNNNNQIWMFINGVKEQFDSIPSGPAGATFDVAFVIGLFASGNSPDLKAAGFCIDELRIWNTLQADAYFQNKAPNFKRSVTVDTSLIAYWKFNGVFTSEGTAYLMQAATNCSFLTTDHYPNVLSTYSFPVSTFPLSGIGKDFALKYPISLIPDGYSVVVSWIDGDGVTQRRMLAQGNGFAFTTDIEHYAGESITYSNAYLEFWNDITTETVTVPSFELETSVLRAQTTLHGGEASDTVTPTVDNTIFATIGALPFVFNSLNLDA
jgi:hypothetical protein